MEAALQGRYRIRMIEETAIEDSDAGLMLRFKDGDAEAFNQLFARHTRTVINFAYRFVRNRDMAEELAQEIFLRVYEAAAGIRCRPNSLRGCTGLPPMHASTKSANRTSGPRSGMWRHGDDGVVKFSNGASAMLPFFRIGCWNKRQFRLLKAGTGAVAGKAARRLHFE